MGTIYSLQSIVLALLGFCLQPPTRCFFSLASSTLPENLVDCVQAYWQSAIAARASCAVKVWSFRLTLYLDGKEGSAGSPASQYCSQLYVKSL